MGKGITFDDKTEAEEYAKAIREQGLFANVSKDRKTGQFLVTISQPKAKLQVETKERGAGLVKVGKMIGRGLRDVGQSLGTPSTEKRPRISQLPRSRSEIPISQTANLEHLKTPGLRGKTISGLPKKS